MKQLKTEVIIKPIYESLELKYKMLYKYEVKKSSMEYFILKELSNIKNILLLEEALLFSNTLLCLSTDLSSKEQKLRREFIYCHLVYLFPKKMVAYSQGLLCLICDAITDENINNQLYLQLLSDEKWMTKILEHTLKVDFASSMVKKYKIDQDRIKRIFLFLCRRIENILQEIDTEMDFLNLKKEILKVIKSYQSTELFRRSVT